MATRSVVNSAVDIVSSTSGGGDSCKRGSKTDYEVNGHLPLVDFRPDCSSGQPNIDIHPMCPHFFVRVCVFLPFTYSDGWIGCGCAAFDKYTEWFNIWDSGGHHLFLRESWLKGRCWSKRNLIEAPNHCRYAKPIKTLDWFVGFKGLLFFLK